MTCPVCHARGDRPCTEGDVVLGHYHAPRVWLESAARVDHAAEAVRLRAAQKGNGR